MTTDLFIGGLMILTLVAGVVIAMTTSRYKEDRQFDRNYGSGNTGSGRSQSKR